MKTNKALLIPGFLALLLSGCSNTQIPQDSYKDKNVNIYRSIDEEDKPVVDKQISLRFFDKTPSVPYISVREYFKEFFKTELTVQKDGDLYKYFKDTGDYISFDSKHDLFASYGLISFNDHPDFKSITGKYFLHNDDIVSTTQNEKTVSLKNYLIDIHDNGEDAYAPLTFLSKLAGGYSSYNVQYNMKDIYVIDRNGELGDKLSADSYSSYFEVWDDDNFTTRPLDLVQYTYGELCFVFDNLRGYTSQLIFGDNNLLSLGLNGVLEQYYPNLKTLLLSQEKEKYYQGVVALFDGLSDGGHTAVMSTPQGMKADSVAKAIDADPQLKPLAEEFGTMALGKIIIQGIFMKLKAGLLGIEVPEYVANPNYYLKDDASKTAYIGFDHFQVDYKGWDDFYNNNGSQPDSNDSYSFILNSFKKAKEDGIENVVIDLTSNGGGDSSALMGIVALLNGAKADFDMNDTFNQFRVTEKFSADINLDGKYDELDVEEAHGYTESFNIGILTSEYSFSCGNLLPSILKELGYKTIGEKTGGGSCAVIAESTADGISYGHSSYRCLSDASGHNIDDGITPDYPIAKSGTFPMYDYSAFFDIGTVGNYLSTAYQE